MGYDSLVMNGWFIKIILEHFPWSTFLFGNLIFPGIFNEFPKVHYSVKIMSLAPILSQIIPI